VIAIIKLFESVGYRIEDTVLDGSEVGEFQQSSGSVLGESTLLKRVY
jgi:hypothetical protein